MSLAWPWALLGLVLLPVLLVGYRRLLRRQAARRAELAELGLVVIGTPARSRHAGPALLLLALALLVVGLARPEVTVAHPRREGTVVLAFDVSSSMAADDVAPTRLGAAKAAARGFVARQPGSVRIGVVAFGDGAIITQRPTTARADVLAAIDRLEAGGGTAVGRGILAALTAIAGRPVLADDPTGPGVLDDSAGRYHGRAAVVLLSDGENTADPDPLQLAELAAVTGVRVHPVGLGTATGTVLEVGGFQVATALDEELLRQVAETTDGRYYTAADGRALEEVYASIELGWVSEPARVEVTAALAATAALLVAAAALLNLRRSGRVV